MGKLKGIRRVRQDGKVYRYHRATGARLPDEIPEDHLDFLEAYLKAERGAQKPPVRRAAAPGSVAHAWGEFARSDAYRALSSAYRDNIARHAREIIRRGGTVPLAQIRPRHIEADMNDLSQNARRMRLKTWRALLAFHGLDHATQVKAPRAAKSQRHARWDQPHLDVFRARWPIGTQQRLAFAIMLYTGCRISDAIRLGPGMLREGWICFDQKKTGGRVEIPLHAPLPDFADHIAHAELVKALAAIGDKHMTWIITAHGSSRSEKAASMWFSAACRAAGLTNGSRRTAHGLRVTCASGLADRGATTRQIGAWTGHESLAEIEGYTKAADKRRMLSGNGTRTQIVQVKKS